jgi:predicted RNase H-like nuclease (RuvC/YqgF family)
MKFWNWLLPEEVLREQFAARIDFVEEYQTALHESYHSNMSHVLKAMEVQTNSIKELMAEISELRSRIKYLENEVLLLDEDYQEFQAGSKTNFLNIAMRTKLKPKDLVSFPKGFEKYVDEVEDLAEKTLTNLPG